MEEDAAGGLILGGVVEEDATGELLPIGVNVDVEMPPPAPVLVDSDVLADGVEETGTPSGSDVLVGGVEDGFAPNESDVLTSGEEERLVPEEDIPWLLESGVVVLCTVVVANAVAEDVGVAHWYVD